MKFHINENVINNLMIFLDRVEIKGLKELTAMNEILNVLNNPIKEEDTKSKENN